MMVVNNQKNFLFFFDGSMYSKIVIDIPGPYANRLVDNGK